MSITSSGVLTFLSLALLVFIAMPMTMLPHTHSQASNATLSYTSFLEPNGTKSANTPIQNTSVNTSTTSTLTTTTVPQASVYTLTFNTIPATGSIVFGNNTYLNGNTVQVTAGSYNADAVAPANFIFGGWSFTDNLTVSNSIEPSTTFSVSGNATLTASFNALATNVLTTFSENGLPANTVWGVVYNGIVQNAIAPNSITFSTLPGNYMFSAANDIVNNAIYTPVPQYGYLVASNATEINFALVSSTTTTPTTTSTSTSTISTTIPTTTPSTSNVSATISSLLHNGNANAIISLFSNYGIPNDSVLISNSSIENTAENGTVANIISPILLNYQEMSNLTSLSQNQINTAKSELNQYTDKMCGNVCIRGTGSYQIQGSTAAIYSFNESIKVPYGNVMQMRRYVKAGSALHYMAYNTHGIITYYNVSITKAQPRLAIKVNGAVVTLPNSTSTIHVPVLKGQKTYSISLSLNSSLVKGNAANYSYEIKFSNGSVISGSRSAGAANYSNAFTLPANQNATITFEMGGNENYTAVDPTAIVIPAVIEYYVPITLYNSQTAATPAPFQQMLSVNSLTYNAYEANTLDNIEFFYASGNVIPSWMEGSTSNTLLNNPTNSIYMYTSTNTIYWLNISSGIPASNSITVYMGFAPTSTNLFNNVNVGEAPQISSTYAQYDDGDNIFLYYNVAPASTTGWTIAGTAGQTATAPSGSHFATANALYANSANGDYMYTSVPSLTSNIIISYDVYTTGLGNMFFLTNSAGKGQMTRLDGRGGSDYSGLATTVSWTSWTAPSSGLSETTDKWYKVDTVVSSTSAYAYIGGISNSLATYGTVTSSSAFTVADDGNYIGLIGDALGSSHITYWNGMIIRAYPPNGAMPSATFGSVESTNAPVLIFQSNPVNYGVTDVITGTATTSGDSVEIEENGNVIAGPAANTISYTICDTTPSLANCLAPGSYTLTVKDITNGQSANEILTVNKGVPTLTLSVANAMLNTVNGITINYGISTVGSQLTASLIVDGTAVSSTSSSNSYTFNPSTGLHTFEVATAGNGNYSSSNVIRQSCIVPIPSQFPSNVLNYAPICVINSQSTATVAPFQAMINISESAYTGNIVYNGNLANFEIFNAIGAVQPAWIESNSSGKLVTWVKLANGIAANSISPLYLGLASNTVNTLSSSGTNGIGEIPIASSSYGQYDDGASVFNNYFAGNSLSGWTTAGTSGQTLSAPSGSPFGTNAFYAGGASGDYLDTTANGQSTNMIIEYYTDEANLDDLYFLVSSSGAGQMGRVGNGGGWYGVTSTSSWTSWTAPPDTGYWSNKWILVSIIVASGSATMYVSPSPGIYGSEIGQNASNTYTVANNGDYFGLVGDGAGGTQYWDGMIIRAYPPNGVMPSSLSGSAVPVRNTCTISLPVNAINFGTLSASDSIATTNAITDDNTGNANAYMLVYGGNWIGPAQFGVSNTTWAASSGVPFASANGLSASPANTLLSVPASGSNNIYFGVGIPGGVPSGPYSQTIDIENTC